MAPTDLRCSIPMDVRYYQVTYQGKNGDEKRDQGE